MSEMIKEEDILYISDLIKDITKKIAEIKDENKTQVNLMENIETDKSALTNALSSKRKPMIIDVFLDNKSVIIKPKIDLSESEIIYCDCPGFDAEISRHEIINSFTIDYLFSGNKFEIYLFSTKGEIQTSLLNSIKRLKLVFINDEQFKNGIGLVYLMRC